MVGKRLIKEKQTHEATLSDRQSSKNDHGTASIMNIESKETGRAKKTSAIPLLCINKR